MAGKSTRTLEERFWSKVHKTDGCWLWTGALNYKGYGVFFAPGQSRKAHRVAYSLLVSHVPAELLVMHRCDNPRCVRPDHLMLGTHADNVADKMAKGRHRPSYGAANGAHTHPDRIARGERSAARRHPERMPRGESHGCAKLTLAQVEEIRALAKSGEMLQRDIAALFGVVRATVRDIISGRSWRSTR